MTANSDHAERSLRKARAGLAAGLSAKNAEQAAANLLRLPEAERATALEPVARLVRAELARALPARQWERLHGWAVRAGEERGLLAAGASGDEEAEARWAILWGCLCQRDWVRAEASLAALEPRLPLRLRSALGAFVQTEGTPGAEAEPLPLLPAPDPRLGYDRPRARPSAKLDPAPGSAAEVEPRTLACFAREEFPAFRETVNRWLASVPPELRGPLARFAAELAVRELLRRAGAAGTLEGPALWVARLCKSAEAPPALEPAVGLALRLLASALPAGVELAGNAEALVEIASVAARYPALRGQVAGVLLAKKLAAAAGPAALQLCGQLLAEKPEPRLLLRALRLLVLTKPGLKLELPPLLGGALAAALVDGPALRAAMLELPPEEQAQSLSLALTLAPLELAERLLDTLWAGAGPQMLGLLEQGFETLLERARPLRAGGGRRAQGLNQLLRSVSASMGMDLSPAELDAMRTSPAGAQLLRELTQRQGGDGPLAPAARALFDRFADRVLPGSEHYLELALEQTRDAAGERRAVDGYLAGRTGGDAFLAGMRSANERELWRTREVLEQELFRRHGRDADHLASALVCAERMGAPRELRRKLAKALLASVGAASTAPPPALATALVMARRLAAPPKPRRQTVKNASARTRPSTEDLFAPRDPAPLPAGRGEQAPAPLRRPKGPFDAAACTERCIAWLPGAYAPSTAANYAGILRRVLRALDEDNELARLDSLEKLLDAGARHWRALEASGRAAGPAKAAVGALGRYGRAEEATP